MCNNAMRAAGLEATDIADIAGFVTIVPAGFAELFDLESKGYEPIAAIVTPVRDSRYLDHPGLKPAAKQNTGCSCDGARCAPLHF
jgi:hypothetical protein